MKLSPTEAKLFSCIEGRNRKSRVDAAVCLGLLVIYLVLRAFQIVPEVQLPMDTVLVISVSILLIHTYFGVRPDDKLLSLLQRYVNSDPEAIKALANNAEST